MKLKKSKHKHDLEDHFPKEAGAKICKQCGTYFARRAKDGRLVKVK